jgi:hypothetical protein
MEISDQEERMTEWPLFIMMGVGVLVLIVLLAVVFNRRKLPDSTGQSTPADGRYMGLGISLGLCYGLPLGVVFGIILDNIALGIALGPAMGLPIGVAMGAAWSRKPPKSFNLPVTRGDDSLPTPRLLVWVLGGLCLLLALFLAYVFFANTGA